MFYAIKVHLRILDFSGKYFSFYTTKYQFSQTQARKMGAQKNHIYMTGIHKKPIIYLVMFKFYIWDKNVLNQESAKN